METNNSITANDNLPALFAKGLSLHDEICSEEGDQRLPSFQEKVRQAIMILEDATRMVSILDLFSRNENVCDLPTESLKFFLLPVLLGIIFRLTFHIPCKPEIFLLMLFQFRIYSFFQFYILLELILILKGGI